MNNAKINDPETNKQLLSQVKIAILNQFKRNDSKPDHCLPFPWLEEYMRKNINSQHEIWGDLPMIALVQLEEQGFIRIGGQRTMILTEEGYVYISTNIK